MSKKAEQRDAAVAHIRGTRGLSVKVAEACGIKRQAVYQWERVPPENVLVVAGVINMPPEKIRPDVFGKRAGAWSGRKSASKI